MEMVAALLQPGGQPLDGFWAAHGQRVALARHERDALLLAGSLHLAQKAAHSGCGNEAALARTTG